MQVRDKIFIDGSWVPSTGTGTIDVINASTEEVMGTIPEGTAHRAIVLMRAGLPPRLAYRRDVTATAAHTPRAIMSP